jgi:hypothetical protein
MDRIDARTLSLERREVDEDRLERAFESMAGEMDDLDSEDPRAAARMMRKLFDASGMRMGSGMEEALRRMEEDPEQIEAERGDVLERGLVRRGETQRAGLAPSLSATPGGRDLLRVLNRLSSGDDSTCA